MIADDDCKLANRKAPAIQRQCSYDVHSQARRTLSLSYLKRIESRLRRLRLRMTNNPADADDLYAGVLRRSACYLPR